eukprot:TRINITY_DN7909_c0_g1_i1.p1 TRINITY_DN7909_c0_g1~~TRINITY_DN7909_c0_g1_i1.p1  ORF type:complete len:573 (-),score=107.89 TRINITY_DN7909_c0_g1_i1:26-1744(-)
MELFNTIYHDEHSPKELTKQFLLQDIIGQIEAEWGFMMMILDDFTINLLNSNVQMIDLTSAGVSDVVNISCEREPFPFMEAIYLLQPTKESVDRFISDFKETPKYKHAHVFFVDDISSTYVRKIAQAKVMASIKTFRIVYMGYSVFETNIFSTDNSFSKLFSPQVGVMEKELLSSAKKLGSFFSVMNVNPIIRFSTSNDINHQFAVSLHEQIEKLTEKDLITDDMTNRPTLLILDRTSDLIAPLVHELTYQALIYDILNVDLDNNTYSNEIKGDPFTVLFSENDILWRHLRHKHFQESRDFLKHVLDEHQQERENIQLTKEYLQKFNQIRTLKDKLDIHIKLASTCVNCYKKKGLNDFVIIEQNLATNTAPGGDKLRKVSSAELIRIARGLKSEEKLRLLLTFYSAGHHLEEFEAFLNGIELTEREEIIYEEYIRLKDISGKFEHYITPSPDYVFDESRFEPALKRILQDALTNNLSTDEFPYLNGSEMVENVSNKRNRNAFKKKKQAKTKLYVFVIGGVTLSEIRTSYTVCDDHNKVYLGSTSVLTPFTFLEEVFKLQTPNDDSYEEIRKT